MAKKYANFDEWMVAVNAYLEDRFGISSDDLPDRDYYSLYEDGCSVSSAARKVTRDEED